MKNEDQILVLFSETLKKQDRMIEELANVNIGLKHVNTELEHVGTRLEHVNTRLEHVNTRLEHVNTRLDGHGDILTEMVGIHRKTQSTLIRIEQRLDKALDLEQRMKDFEDRVEIRLSNLERR